MSTEDATAIQGAFTSAGTSMMETFVSLLPAILTIAVLGFGVYTVYKLVKKVRKGGK